MVSCQSGKKLVNMLNQLASQLQLQAMFPKHPRKTLLHTRPLLAMVHPDPLPQFTATFLMRPYTTSLPVRLDLLQFAMTSRMTFLHPNETLYQTLMICLPHPHTFASPLPIHSTCRLSMNPRFNPRSHLFLLKLPLNLK